MKHCNILILLVSLATLSMAQDEKIIFLHHSTGGMVYSKGSVAKTFAEYNKQHGTNISISERNFPNKPYPWENYPYDYWNIWVNGYCEQQNGTETYKNVECLESLTREFDLIIFKHCFPGAEVLEDTGTPNIASKRKSLENYKLQYRALRNKLDKFPDNDFIIWTLVPLHRLSSNAAETAERAKEFVDWVKSDWLTEDGKKHHNIHIFDYFSFAAELGNQENGNSSVQYCLKYEYELAHDNGDSHPNDLACKEIGDEFAKFILATMKSKK
jgi:hypothetical protein